MERNRKTERQTKTVKVIVTKSNIRSENTMEEEDDDDDDDDDDDERSLEERC